MKNVPGYLIPETIDPDDNICLCVPIPNDPRHIQAFMGQIVQLGYWYNWEKESTKSGKLVATKWREIYACISDELECLMSTGCGCGCSDQQPIGQRINDGGYLEVTFDGVTWEEQRAGDTRFTNPILPAIPGDDGDEKRCKIANSITTGLEAEKDATLARKEAEATFAEFMAGITSFLVGLGVVTGGVTAVLAVISTMIAALYTNISAATFAAYFSGATWDALLCILFCNMEDDGSFTEAQWQAIKSAVLSEIGGGAGDWIHHNILAMGTVGLTNLGRQLLPGTKSCGGCDCTLQLEWWDTETQTSVGTVTSSGLNQWDITSGVDVFAGDNYSVCRFTAVGTLCFKVTSVTWLTGTECPGRRWRLLCGGGGGFFDFVTANDSIVVGSFDSFNCEPDTTPFSVRITVVPA